MVALARGGRQEGGPDLAGPAEPALGSRPVSDAKRGTFKNVVHERDAAPPRPVDEYLAELDRLIAAHDYFKQDKVIPAIGRGAASREVVQRLALEFYYLGKWMTPEFALLVANAPDAYAGERVAAGSGYARTLYEGLQKHYGLPVKNFEVHAYAEPEHGDKAADIFRLVATTRAVQERCREAIRNYLLVAEARVRAMNRWVE